MSEETAEQVRELITKGAAGGHLFFTTDDAHKTHAELKARASRSPRSRPTARTASTSASATRSATTSASGRCSPGPEGGDRLADPAGAGGPGSPLAGLNLQHCALTVIRYAAAGPPNLITVNDVAHLPADLRGTGLPPEYRV